MRLWVRFPSWRGLVVVGVWLWLCAAGLLAWVAEQHSVAWLGVASAVAVSILLAIRWRGAGHVAVVVGSCLGLLGLALSQFDAIPVRGTLLFGTSVLAALVGLVWWRQLTVR